MSEVKGKYEESSVEVGTEKDKNFKYADMAIHCSRCNTVTKIKDPRFQKLQTGINLTVNEDTRLSLGCEVCKHSLAIVFLAAEEPIIEDVEPIVEPVAESNEKRGYKWSGQ